MTLEADRYWARILSEARRKQKLRRVILNTRDLVRRQRRGWRA